jgi:1,2-diacylglycerol 3-alpha-glucosyltransferase
MHIAIIWQRFLPYHIARIIQANKRLRGLGFRLTAIEVASQDATYGFPKGRSDNQLESICCFQGESYHYHTAKEVYNKVLELLNDVTPDIVFAPAIAFPEGIAALAYRIKSGARSVVMDDAWEHTDRKGFVVQSIKRIIYKNADAAFIPAASHLHYYRKLGFVKDRIVLGVDVVDNDYFSSQVRRVQLNESEIREGRQLPLRYFLFVGRFLRCKGLETLLEAYEEYRKEKNGGIWNLILVGTGDSFDALYLRYNRVPGVCFAGGQFGDDLCEFYGLARILIVPSYSESWGLVVNEAMASGLPVIVSTGCGAAKTLVQEGENGWTFEPGNSKQLTQLMLLASSLSGDVLERMGQKSQSIVADWSLDRFADGILKAIKIPRRQPAGLISDIMTKLWKGRVRTT